MKKLLLFSIGLLISTNCFAAPFGYVPKAITRSVVSSAGTAVKVASSTTPYHDCTICAETSNAGTVYIGDSTTLASTKTGVYLGPGDCQSFPIALCNEAICGDLTDIYVDSTASSDAVGGNYSVRK